jgi:hypothetical protein
MKLKWIIAVGFCVLLAVIVTPRFFGDRDLPQKLHGVWETNATEYDDRHFLLDKNAIGFGIGDGNINWYEIIQIDQTTKRNKTLYTIEYKIGQGSIFKRSLYYDPGNGGMIKFENQSNIEWFLVNSKNSLPAQA